MADIRSLLRLKRKSFVAQQKNLIPTALALCLFAAPAMAQQCAEEVEALGERLGIEVVSPEFFTEIDIASDLDVRTATNKELLEQLQTSEAETVKRLGGRLNIEDRLDIVAINETEPLWVHDYDEPDVLLARSRLVGARTFSLLGREDFCRRGLDEAKLILGPLLDQ